MKKWIAAMIVGAMALTLSSCGGGGGGATATTPATVIANDGGADTTVTDTGPAVSDLNLKEVANPNVDTSGAAVAFSVSGAPAAGASGGPCINAYYSAAKAFDGSTGTWWAGEQNAGAWDLYYGFSENVPLDSVYINFYNSNYVPDSVALETSTDGTTWTAVETKTAGESKPLFTMAAAQPVRYLHIAMSGNPATGFPLIREIDWTPATGNTGAYATPGANDDYYFAVNALDGDTNTWWVGDPGAGAWDFYYNPAAPEYIALFTAELFNSNYRPASMVLSVSDDGQAWTDLGELTQGGSPALFVDASPAYWRLRMTGNPPSTFPLVRDISTTLPAGASSGDSINAFYAPANAFDGNPNTWWTGSQDQSEWNLFYGYETATDIGAVSIAYYAATHAPQATELLYSNDGRNWTSAGTFPAGANPSLAAGVSATYIRFKLTGAPSVGYPLIKDITVTGSLPVCGDGALDSASGEQCDDGNTADGDGCSAACLTEIPDPVSSGSYVIVDTGQTSCYGDSLSMTCPASGASYFGQDAQYTGAQPSYTDNGDGTVTDNNTGLMWQQDPGAKMTFSAAVSGASSFSLAGYTDWRLPTIKELYSLIQFNGTDPSGYSGTTTSGLVPFIDTNYFAFEYGDTTAGERIIDSQFASSNVYAGDGFDAETVFGVNFADGRIKGYGTTVFGTEKTFFVLYVRGGNNYGVNSFADNGDGTITDAATGLMWEQGDSGSGMAWADALATCEARATAGYTDWRLPSAKELQSIVDYTRAPSLGSAAIDPLFSATSFTNEGGQTDWGYYWSSTSHANYLGGSSGAYVAFGRGLGYIGGAWNDVHGAGCQRSDPKSGDPSAYPTGHGPQGDAIRIYNYVRCVRN